MNHIICSVCGIEKSEDNFYKCRNKYFDKRCKACQGIRGNDANFRKAKNERQRKRYANNPEYRKKLINQCKEWVDNNPEKRKQIIKKYNEANPDIQKKCWQNYARRHPERKKASSIAARKKFPERHQARKRIQYRVKTGKIPKANSLNCTYCKNRAAHYHHHKGYEKPFNVDVVPVCTKCHGSLG